MIGKYYDITVGENIGIGNIVSINDAVAIEQAAETGGALDFITSFPDKFNTELSMHKHSSRRIRPALSGGQWQRLALARAFMRIETADLLLLDEPSASLDPEAEYKLFKGLKDNRKKTTVYISHRFNTVRAATRIMVFRFA